MNLRRLKAIRRAVSLVFLVVVSVLFLDLGNTLPSWLRTGIAAFQILPALTKTLVGVGLSTMGVAVVLGFTFLIGRVYCSSLCPLGTLQDLVINIAGRRGGEWRFGYSKPHYRLHYALLAITLVSFAGGSLVILNALEPFSTYGRALQGIIRPLVVGGNNALAYVLSRFDVYSLSPHPLYTEFSWVLALTVLILAVIVYLAYHHGRLFCNSVCPAGALLGLVSRYSLFRIVVDEDTCTECGLCEMVCKAECIDSSRKTVEYAACVSCFNCLNACPTVGLKYSGVHSVREETRPAGFESGRRMFLAGAAIALVDTVGVSSDTAFVGPRGSRQSALPVTPPGSRGVEHFSSRCTACNLCVSVCPPQVLRPAFLAYGIAGVFQPQMDYWTAYCSYECVLCTTVCPTGAIMPLTVEAKKLVQLGKTKFVKDDCIVITKKTECGACSEHCPTKAVKMVPHEKLLLPELNNDICVGCGACEKACPTKPRKAIFVESNVVHLQAKPPVLEKPKEGTGVLSEFPF